MSTPERPPIISTTLQAPDDWDAFVRSAPGASVYHHRAAIAIAARTFGLRTYFLSARDAGGALVGILPLVEQSSVMFGRFLVSVPFFTYGGIIANDASTAYCLACEAGDLAKSRGARHVELRHCEPMDLEGFANRQDKVSMVLALPDSVETLSKQLGSKLRSQIKRAQRDNVVVTWGGAELIPEFYNVFAQSMRDLGTPVYPRRFFDAALEAFADSGFVIVVRVDGVTQAAGILVDHGGRIEVPWAAATPAAKKASVNMRMYWEMLSKAVQRGSAAFDFGRSTIGSGTYKFKAQWGAEPMQLHWHYWLPAGADVPQLNQSNPKFDLAVAAWKRLPLWVANAVGPLIIRSLP